MLSKIHARHQKAPVIMIDYLRKVKTDSNRLDERLRVDEILSTLTDLAKTHNLPVLVISELARDSYKTGQHLSMHHLKSRVLSNMRPRGWAFWPPLRKQATDTT